MSFRTLSEDPVTVSDAFDVQLQAGSGGGKVKKCPKKPAAIVGS